MTNKISLIIDFDDTIVESNTARDVLRDFVPSEYDQIAKLYRTKNCRIIKLDKLNFYA